jgi:cytochrome c2
MRRAFPALLLSAAFISCAPAKEDPKLVVDTTPWIEPDFPFFSSVLDARNLGELHAKDNLTPRGLILNLGHNLWACFDTDLLRIACIWQAEPGQPPITLNALAPGSYQIAGQKTKDGQEDLPKPVGRILLTNGIYPGIQHNSTFSLNDPRPQPPSENEVGRGPIPEGKFDSVSIGKNGVILNYSLGDTQVAERLFAVLDQNKFAVIRDLRIRTSANDLAIAAGTGHDINRMFKDPFVPQTDPNVTKPALQYRVNGTLDIKRGEQLTWLKPDTQQGDIRLQIYCVDQSDNAATTEALSQKTDDILNAPFESSTARWPQTVTTAAQLSKKTDAAYVTDIIPLPLDNPWHRKLRLADITFLDDQGNAAAVTFDGDVWLVSGLKGDLQEVKWKRYTSGLHEPMNITVRDNEIFVFDRNGIWKILDKDNDGEAETHELFCNLFTQTAETREFPNTMKLGPDGAFYLAKGGQQGTTLGKDNGTVLRVAPDGKSYTVLGWGLRQPFIGVHPKTGLVTASDQQGNYVPSTPLHVIKDNQFYGFLSGILPEEQYPAPIAEPIAWIPHPVNPSGASQVWLTGAQMGDLNDECIHIGYNRPELFRVLVDDPANPTRATVVPFTRDVGLPPLNGSVNPADGQLYVTGFQVWGTTAKELSGLSRIRYTGQSRILLKDCVPTEKGVLLRFTHPIDPTAATKLSNYSIERWNYKRTAKYGSPHLKLDGQPGQDWMQPSSAYLSTDGKSVFIGIPDMKPVMQMRVGWGLKGTDGAAAQNSAYFTPSNLNAFDPVKEGFGDIKVDLTPKQAVATAEPTEKPTVETGARIAEMFGCMACHSIDGSVVGKVGPSWKGLYGSKRTLKDGKTEVRANEEYLHESIVNPSAKVVKGYEKFDSGMPIYSGILNETQIQSLILYIKTLK